MNGAILVLSKVRIWNSVGVPIALAACLALAVQPTVTFAQPRDSNDSPIIPSKAKSPAAGPKKGKRTAMDDSADDLNSREAIRAAGVVRAMSKADSAAPAAGSATPVPISNAIASDQKVTAMPPPSTASPFAPQLVQAQLTPGPTPRPVPIQPPAFGTAQQPGPTIAGGGAPGRPFAQSQVVPPQPPTLTLEVNKGTAIKLPGAAATVFVAAPDIADVQVRSPNMVYVFAKKPGETVLYAVDAQDQVLLNTIVSVTSPITRMKSALDVLHPANGVIYGNQGETIVLSGTVRSTAVAEDAHRLALQHVNNQPSRVISNIRVEAPTQVQLRVKVAEVRRDALKRVGINWQNINNIALFGLGTLGIGAGVGGAVRTIQNTGGVASGALAFQTDGGLNGLVDFLATQNQATILAEPNLIAMSGETASFLAGGEVPLITPQGGTNNSLITITYKQVGVSLAFTPTIIGDRINLKVAPEVSQLSSVGSITVPLTATAVVTVPGIQTRKASTTIELGSGQSFAIAGLLQSTSQQDVVKMPWLGDIPVLGSLFKSDAYQRSETELVIIITPYFVEPTSGKLRTPLTDRVPPTDADRLVYQRMNHPTPPQRISVGRDTRTSGPTAGFKLD